MANGASIDAVYTIANLPRPIDQTNGRILASTVHSLSHSKKRKRSQVAVSVDGEGVNIYSVKTRRVLSSYPVPPHTYFVTPPCSLQQEATKDRPACRFTYSATKTSPEDSKTRVLCLEEQVHQADPSNPKRNEQSLPSSSPVVWIDTLPAYNIAQSQAANHDVLVLQDQGQLTSFSERLEEELWNINLTSLVSAAEELNSSQASTKRFSIQHAELVDLDTANQGLLKGREDILAALSIPVVVPEPHTQSELLIVITREESAESMIHIFALRSRTSSRSTGQRAQPQHLLTWHLPAVTNTASSNPDTLTPSYSLNAGSGILYQLDHGKITAYDLSGVSPRIATNLNTSEQKVQSIVPLSSALLLASSLQNYTIYDTKYGSIQAAAPISEPTSTETSSKKRKITESKTMPSSAYLIGYFGKSGVAAALSGQNLIAIQVGGRASNSKRRKLAEPLLIDSIGKAVGSSIEPRKTSKLDFPAVLGKVLKDNATNPKQHQRLSEETIVTLDRLLAKDDIRKFEAVLAAEVKVKTNLDKLSRKREKEFAKHGEPDLEWIFPVDKPLPLFREKALYALSRIFSWRVTTNGSSSSSETHHQRLPTISINTLPPNLFQWLTVTGQLTAELIQQALQARNPSENSVARGDVVLALANFDPSLAHLYTLLTHHPRLEVEEVVNAIKLIILSLDNSTLPQPDPVLSITSGDLPNGYAPIDTMLNGDYKLTNGDVHMTNGNSKSGDEESEDAIADAAMDDVEDELDRAIDTLEKPIRGDSLRQAITKLDSFASSVITSTLRQQLSHHELVFFIHILRIELADGGWTTRYLDDGPEDDSEVDEFWDQAIGVIAKALGCAVDALGMAGWLMSSAADPMDAVDKLLDSLRAEISATLEGVHEATFLTGVLSEFVRYQTKRVNAGYKPFATVPNAGKKSAHLDGRVWRYEVGEDKVLPVGLKVVPKKVEETKKIGGRPREAITKREEGIARSKMVGKYSFEQIRF